MAGNLMKHYERQILDLTEEARNELVLECIRTVVSDGNGGFLFNDDTVFAMVLIGAKIGIGNNRPLKQREKMLSKYVAETIFTNQSEQTLTEIIESMQLNEDMYDAVRKFFALGWESMMAYFRYILCWALADGVIEKELEERLESMFGLFFVLDFGNSGLESVPAPRIQLTGLEAEIALLLKKDEHVTFFRDIQAYFPNKSKSELQRALDRMCEKGTLSCVDTAVGKMYSLENADSIEIDRSASSAAFPKSGTTTKCEAAKSSKSQKSEAQKQRKEKEKRQEAAKAYEEEYAEAQKKRELYIDSERKKSGKAYQKMLEQLRSEYEANCAANQQELYNARAAQVTLEQELQEAGLFVFGKKNQLRADIEETRRKIQRLADEKLRLDAAYESAKTEKEAARKSELEAILDRADIECPPPKGPRVPQNQAADYTRTASQRKPTAQQLANEEIKKSILAGMDPYRLYTSTDIIMENHEIGVFPLQRLVPLLRDLCHDGLLEKIVDVKKTYYRLLR